MNNESLKGSLNSRYIVKKALGRFRPWNGYSVADSLSEKEYLFFSVDVPLNVSVSIDDLRMRDYLFSRRGNLTTRTLSLQQSNGSVTFLLPYTDLVPLTKAFPSMKPGKALTVTRTLVSYVLEMLRENASFHNLGLESLSLVHDAPAILPTAYLLPGEIFPRILGESCAEGACGAPYGDLRALGEILSVSSQYLGSEHAEQAKRLCVELQSLGPTTGGKVFHAVLDELAAFGDPEREKGCALPTRTLHLDPPTPALRALRQSAVTAREGEKRLVILTAARGEGKTHFLERIERRLVDEWGYARGSIAGDLAIFQDLPEKDSAEPAEFALVDDHAEEPLLACHVIDYVCQAVDRCKLVVIGMSENSSLARDIAEEFSKREITVQTIELPSLNTVEKKRILLHITPPHAERSMSKALESGEPLALARLNLIAALDEAGSSHGEIGRAFLDALSPEERSVLGILAVFGFEAPLSFLLGIYAPEEESVFTSLQKLTARGLVRSHEEASSLSGGELCLVYGLSSASLARAVLESIPPERKEAIHRNIAHLLKDKRNAPAMYTFFHLTRSGEREEAALKGLEILGLLMRRKRLAALNCFNTNFMEERLDRSLPVDRRLDLYLELGNHFSLIGNMERAESFFRRCREEIAHEQEPSRYRNRAVEAARKESEILEKRGEFLKAEKLLEKTLDTHGDELLSAERAKLYNDMAWIHYRLGAFDRSWEHCLLVHRLLDEKQNPVEIAQAYNLMGTINWNRSKYDDAILCYKRCLALREELNDEIGIATSYNNLGLVYRSLGSLVEARECFQKSMEIKKRHENLPGLAAAHLNLALVYLDMENLREAERSCVTAARLAESIGNQQLLAEAYGTMGEIQFLQGNFEKAASYYLKDRTLCDRTKSLRERAVVCRKLGELNFALGKLPETIELIAEARSLNQKIGSRLETALLNLLEGRMQLAQGKLEDARSKLEGASLELSLLGKKKAASAIAAEIGTLYLEEGNEPLAREYLARATSLRAEGETVPPQVLLLQENLEKHSPLGRDQIVSDAGRFRALCRVISLMWTIRDAEGLYAMITDTARRITAMERAALFLKSEGKDSYRVASSSAGGFVPGSILADRAVIALLGVTRQLGYPLDVSRTAIPEGKVASEFLEGRPRIICIPLRIHGEPAGFLYLDSTRSAARTPDDDHSFLVAFGQEAALALERMFLAEKIDHMEKPRIQVNPATARPKERITSQDLVGASAPMKHIYELVEGIKDLDTTVLLTGSNGTGKDLIAKTIHYSGARADKPFVSINCSAIPGELLESELFGHERGAFTGAHRQRAGHFESANGGTIFLNEIGDMPLHLQPKLLHVLEKKKFRRVGGTNEISTNVRIIAATNKDLLALVKEGRFREDLYYRINIFPIRVPDLKERSEDIEPLIEHFLATFCRLYGIPVKKISAEAMALLAAYDWPGNVRELENLVNRVIIISKKDTILPEDLPDYIVKRPESVRAAARTTIEETIDVLLENMELSSSDPILPKVEGMIVRKIVDKIGDKTKAAQLLGISKPTVYSKLKQHGKNKNI